MFSEHKRLLRLMEWSALAGATAMLLQAVRMHLWPPVDYPAFLVASLCTGWVLLSLGPVLALGGEYIRTVRRATTPDERSDGLSAAETAFLVRWSPRAYKLAAWLALAILLGTMVTFGGVTITTGEPTDPARLPALFLYLSVFHLVCLPFLGSARRMPGSYADHADPSV